MLTMATLVRGWREAGRRFNDDLSDLDPRDEEDVGALLAEIGLTYQPSLNARDDVFLGDPPTEAALTRGAQLLAMDDAERAAFEKAERRAGRLLPPSPGPEVQGFAHSDEEKAMTQLLMQEGRFKARPKSWVVEENKNTGTLQLALTFAVTAVWNGQEWEDWTRYALEKTGYFYLAKKDGSPNEPCIKSLREALGWDGVDLEALQNTDWSGVTVQITTAFEEYNGEQRLKVKFINPENWEGVESQPLDAAALKGLNAKWGPKLRAIAPKATPKSAPAPRPAAKPTSPPKSATPPPPPDDPPAPAAVPTKDSAWALVLKLAAGDVESAKAEWAKLLKQVQPNKPSADFTPEDWASVEALANKAIPF